MTESRSVDEIMSDHRARIDREELDNKEALKAALEAIDHLADEIEERVNLAHGYIADAKINLELLPQTAHDLLDKAMAELRNVSR